MSGMCLLITGSRSLVFQHTHLLLSVVDEHTPRRQCFTLNHLSRGIHLTKQPKPLLEQESSQANNADKHFILWSSLGSYLPASILRSHGYIALVLHLRRRQHTSRNHRHILGDFHPECLHVLVAVKVQHRVEGLDLDDSLVGSDTGRLDHHRRLILVQLEKCKKKKKKKTWQER